MTNAKKKTGNIIFDPKTGYPFKKGDAVFIRTVTMYHVGRVESVGVDSITLLDGSWVADVGRLSEALSTGKLLEVEKAPSWLTVARGAIIDIYPWVHPLPDATK